MPVQMIVTDLDSTLLPKDKKLTAYTKQIITRGPRKRNSVCCCNGQASTGRSPAYATRHV